MGTTTGEYLISAIEAISGVMEELRSRGMLDDTDGGVNWEAKELDTEVWAWLAHLQDMGSGMFRNFYRCPECGTTWTMEWSATCNDRCPSCRLEIQPHRSEDIEELD